MLRSFSETRGSAFYRALQICTAARNCSEILLCLNCSYWKFQ